MIYRKMKTLSRQDMGELLGSQTDSCINKQHQCPADMLGAVKMSYKKVFVL